MEEFEKGVQDQRSSQARRTRQSTPKFGGNVSDNGSSRLWNSAERLKRGNDYITNRNEDREEVLTNDKWEWESSKKNRRDSAVKETNKFSCRSSSMQTDGMTYDPHADPEVLAAVGGRDTVDLVGGRDSERDFAEAMRQSKEDAANTNGIPHAGRGEDEESGGSGVIFLIDD